MSVFTLAISVWPLPIYLGIYNWPNITVSYAISFFTASLFFHHLTHSQLCIISTLVQPLHSFWSYFSSLPQKHFGHLLTWGFIFWCHFLFLFLLFMGKYWSSLPSHPPVDLGLLPFVEARLVFWNIIYLLTNPKSLFQPQISLPNIRLLNIAAFWTSPLGCPSRHFRLTSSKSKPLISHLHHPAALSSPRALSILVSGRYDLPVGQAKTLEVIPSSFPFFKKKNLTSNPLGSLSSSTIKTQGWLVPGLATGRIIL